MRIGTPTTINLNNPDPQPVALPGDGEYVVTNVVVRDSSHDLSAAEGDLEVILSATGEVLATLPLKAFVSPGRYFNLPVAPHPSGNDAGSFATAANAPAAFVQPIGYDAALTVDIIGYRK